MSTPNSSGTGDTKPDSARPSFTGFWKRSKDRQAARNLTFVSSKLGQPSAQNDAHNPETSPAAAGGTEPSASAEAKAKERRQQVRRAQRQHRQRKANYTKQLEMDITKLRDDIARVEGEVEALKSQNGVIRSRLAGAGAGAGAGVEQLALPLPVSLPSSIPLNMDIDNELLPGLGDEMTAAGIPAFTTARAPEYAVSLDMAEHLGTPAYRVRRVSPSLSGAGGNGSGGGSSTGKVTNLPAPEAAVVSDTTPEILGLGDDFAVLEASLSEDQVDQVINFILALEHCCWNHIEQKCFEHHHHHNPPIPSEPPSKDCNRTSDEDITSDEKVLNGHTLTATALALQSAPAAVFSRIQELQDQPPASSTTNLPTTTPPPLEWSSRTLSLTNLRRLARALNPPSSSELTPELAPVQAWFELATRYGIAIATNPAVLRRLESRLAPEMNCVVFGAAVSREVFENALLETLSASTAAAAAVGFGVSQQQQEQEQEQGQWDVGSGGFGLGGG